MTRPQPPRRRLRVSRFVALCTVAVFGVVGLYFLHKFQVYREAFSIRERAAAAAAAGNWPLSVALYRSYLRFEPEDTEALQEFAASLEAHVPDAPGKRGELVSVYEKLRQFNSLTPAARRRQARHNLTLGNTAAARDAVEAILREPGPPDAPLLELAALCEEKEGRWPKAIDFYKKAVATGAADADAYFRLAAAIRRDDLDLKGPDAADAVMDDLVAARPDDPKARLARARYNLQLRRTDKARADLEHAFRKTASGAENLDVALALTAIAVASGDFPLADEVLAKARVVHPDNLPVALQTADLQLRRGDTAAARKTLLGAAAKPLPLNSSTLDLAELLLDMREPGAVARIAEGFAAAGFAFGADYLRGRVKSAAGDWAAALPLLKKATGPDLDALPQKEREYLRRPAVAALLALADCYALANEPDARAKAVAQALRLDDRSARAALAQAQVYARDGKVADAVALYARFAPDLPAARVALLELLMQQVLARPADQRDWSVVERWYGPEPRSPEVEVVHAGVLIQTGKVKEGLELLAKAAADPKAAHLPGPSVALALARAGQSADAGLRTLEEAQKRLGDRLEFRLARLRILSGVRKPDPAAVAAVGDNTGGFSSAERYELFARVGEALARLDKTAQAIDFTRRAAAENPFDLNLRIAVFKLALKTKDEPLQAQTLKEIDGLDAAGAVRTVLEVMREMAAVKPGDAARADELAARLKPAREKRPDWPAVEVLLADLDLLAGRRADALTHYRRAMELGDESAAVVANVVPLLLERQGQLEALDLLNRAARRGTLGAGMVRQLVVLRSAYGEGTAQSLAWARSAESQKSLDYRDHLMRAGVLGANGARADARKAVEQSLSLRADAPEAWVELVRLAAADGKLTEAKALAEKAAAALKPDAAKPEAAAAAALALSACQEIVGDAARAEGYARQALTLTPRAPDANRQLSRLLTRAGKPVEADALFQKLADDAAAPAEARRYARRMLAYAKVMRSNAPAEVNAALDLLETNLLEGNKQTEDRRAKALVMATDPLRQQEAIDLLTDTSKLTPLTAEESYYLGRMHDQQGRLDQAEAAFADATRAVALALPEYFAALARVQVARKRTDAAGGTVALLKANFPKTWEAVSEEARLLAKTGRGSDAAKLLTASDFAAAETFRVKTLAPFLEEIGLPADAEKVYRAAAEAPAPLTHTPLAGFLLRTGRAPEVVELAEARAAKAPVGVTARLLAGAARVQPVALTPPKSREAWAAAVKRVEAWVAAKLAADVGNADLLFAQAELDDLAGRYPEEVAAYERLIALQPESDVFANNFAVILALQGDGGERPMKLVNGVIARRGPRATFLDTRAIVETAGGRFDKAIADLNAAITLDPKPAYYFHLAVAEEGKAGTGGAAAARDAALTEATRRGLTKANLHPKEWAAYDRLLPAKQ